MNIGIAHTDRQAVSKTLGHILANEYVLYTKTRNYHWNVVGPLFAELHKFFETQYEELDGIIDDVAERIRALGEPAPGSLAAFLQITQLNEAADQGPNAMDMIVGLLQDHEAIVCTLRSAIETVTDRHHDVGTGDFLTGIMEQHEKMAWMLRAHSEH